ncbi:MAG TPA: response regulator [Polyangia bacterium]
MAERGPSLLVVDDEPGICEMLAFGLDPEGYAVTTARSGEEAVALCRQRAFELAITDFKMPGMDGAQTVEALKRLDPTLEIIVATGYGSVETAVACMRHGAFDYIAKPFDLDRLIALLERARARRRSTLTQAGVPRRWEEFQAYRRQALDAVSRDLERQFVLETLRRAGGELERAARDAGLALGALETLAGAHGLRDERPQ